jgi:hypothetical protein
MQLTKEEKKMFDEEIGFGESGNFERVSCKSQSAGSVLKRDCWNKCDVCGRFIPYRDIEAGKAVHRMITPDSDVSYESFETLCAEHTPNVRGDSEPK